MVFIDNLSSITKMFRIIFRFYSIYFKSVLSIIQDTFIIDSTCLCSTKVLIN